MPRKILLLRRLLPGLSIGIKIDLNRLTGCSLCGIDILAAS
jgi:hypothetical protein